MASFSTPDHIPVRHGFCCWSVNTIILPDPKLIGSGNLVGSYPHDVIWRNACVFSRHDVLGYGLRRGAVNRCIVYTSAAAGPLAPAALFQLVESATAKNRQLGVTGRLIYEGSRFVQLIEGPHAIIGDLYDAIEADQRHSEILCLIDREIDIPSYSDWAHLVPGADAAERAAFAANLQRPGHGPDLNYQLRDDSLASLTRTRFGAFLLDKLRIKPSQQRASQTVDQLFTAAEVTIERDGLGAFSLDGTAREANVSLQSAYRYFTNTDAFLRAVTRRRQITGTNRALQDLAQTPFRDEEHIVTWIVERMADGLLAAHGRFPIIRTMYQRHTDVFDDGMWIVADAMRVAMARCGIPCAHLGDEQLALGLSGMAAAIRTAFLKDALLLRSPRVRAGLVAAFLATLRVR